ncbi:hypothetical protein K438DRAFT_1656778 [Mycena galopus ATCC 62051]|nr:hypothetical protein K438DRAFT_1656778 [Mycena galopus ATCC 62051]
MPPVAPNTPQELPVNGPLDKDSWRKGCILKLDDGWVLTLGDVIFQAHGIIIGRGTVVIRATVTACPPSREDLMGKVVVVKWGWIPTTRANEAEIVKSARDRALQRNEHILRHLPEIFHQQSFESLTPACQRDLLQHLPSGMYEERVFRLIVQAELKPITELNDPNKLAKVFKQIFECYRWLYEEAKIIHRDVSLTNLMYHEIDGDVYGVLNDFDLALRLGDMGDATSKQRTGTKPYMAIDLLVDSPPNHLYRHDLESFLYVLVFLTCQIEGSDLAKWKDQTIAQLEAAKASAIARKGFPANKNHFEKFNSWIVDLTDLFGTGLNNRRVHNTTVRQAKRKGRSLPEFDDRTLGGAVDFDKFAAILDEPITS